MLTSNEIVDRFAASMRHKNRPAGFVGENSPPLSVILDIFEQISYASSASVIEPT